MPFSRLLSDLTRRLDQLFAELPELLRQDVALRQFARLLLIAVSKVFACDSLQLMAEPYIAGGCCSLEMKPQGILY